MIGIIQYRAGNLASVSNALDRLGAEYRISDNRNTLDQCQAILFPGVGHAASAMEDLRNRGLDQWLRQTRKPVLGICLGMQLLYEESEEGESTTLGILPGKLQQFNPELGKVPHMGWNRLHELSPHPILKGIREEDHFYFVHSYHAPVTKHTLARCHYGVDFAAVAGRDNFIGVQFHPEKSADTGMLLLENFLVLSRESAPGELQGR